MLTFAVEKLVFCRGDERCVDDSYLELHVKSDRHVHRCERLTLAQNVKKMASDIRILRSVAASAAKSVCHNLMPFFLSVHVSLAGMMA